MNIIKIEQYDNGSHANQFGASVCPLGWAIIPTSMELPQSFPFVDIEVDGNTVTAMTEREVPTQEEIEPEPTAEERIAELEKENKRLDAKAKANNEQIAFLENCLLEMADEIYA